jgi:hypothetical protein
MEMDDEDLKGKMMEVLSRAPRAIQRERMSGEWAQRWIREQGRPAFDRLQRVLNEMGVQEVASKWQDYTGMLSFGRGGNEFSYLIDLTVSPKGVTGTTQFEVPDQDVRKHGPVKDIVKWTQEEVVQDFIAGLDSWHPEKK